MAQNLGKIQQASWFQDWARFILENKTHMRLEGGFVGRPIPPLRSLRSRMSKILPDANNEGEHCRIIGNGLVDASPCPTDSHKFSFVRNYSKQPDTDALIGRRYSFWNGFSG